ncbi:MAG: PqqD family protein [bacterium]
MDIYELILSESPKKVEHLLYRREPEGIGIVLNESLGCIDYLNPTAATIFELCNGTKQIRNIVEIIFNQFEIEITKPEVVKDTIKCIRDLEGRKLLKHG